MGEMIKKFGMGWLPDYPDFRDYTVDRDEVSFRLKKLGQEIPIRGMLENVGVLGSEETTLKPTKNLRKWCSPIEDQASIGSCTAHAAIGLVEYFERKAFGEHIDASRLFLYKVTRNMMHLTGDTGAYVRTTMGALVLFGVPPEEYWLYNIADFDREPPAFCYAYAQNYQAISYYRLDQGINNGEQLKEWIKRFLAHGLPSMFGFTVYSSYTQAETTGKIPYPTLGESVVGGHAVVAVGYDDDMKVKNTLQEDDEPTTGAFLIRNSWGTGWGDEGYGWLPYDYVKNGLAVDWWSLLRNEWIKTEVFGL